MCPQCMPDDLTAELATLFFDKDWNPGELGLLVTTTDKVCKAHNRKIFKLTENQTSDPPKVEPKSPIFE